MIHPNYHVSGFTSDGRPIYHPTVFQQMVNDGIIDQHGYPITPTPEPIIDRTLPPVICERIGWR